MTTGIQTITYDRPAVQPSRSNPTPQIDLKQLDLPTLARRCLTESRLFYHRKEYNPTFAYELFRRALVERNEDAWDHLYQHYAPLVEHWIRRTGSFNVSGESSDFFIGAAFTRFWRAIPAQRFSDFPTLASLLNYLRRCANCVVIDSARAQSYAEVLPEESVNWNSQRFSYIDEEATERVSRGEFWTLIDTLLQSEIERIVVRSSFILGMKPSDIFQAYPDLFATIDEVYAIKRSVLVRLRRSNELKNIY